MRPCQPHHVGGSQRTLIAYGPSRVTICSVKVRPTAGQEKEVELTLRVDDRIDIVTPTDMLDETVAARYSNMILADKEFYVSRPVSIILGANVYSRIIQQGIIMPAGPVLLQNAIFGWLISRPCSA